MKHKKNKRHRKLIFRFINAYSIIAAIIRCFLSASAHEEKKKAFYYHNSVVEVTKVKLLFCD